MGVATAVAIGGLAMTAGTTAMSFMNASEQKAKQQQAEGAAAAAMAEARKKLEVNFYDQMAVKKEPYELQREAMLSQGAQAIQAGQESDRGAAATAGKVQMAQNEAQAGIRTEMGKEMTAIEEKQLAEDSRLRDLGAQLDLGEAEGQQMIAANAEEASTAATQQGVQGLMSMGSQGLNMINLYPKTGAPPVATPTAGPAPANPLPGTAASYGPAGLNWSPMSNFNTPQTVAKQNPFQPQGPQPGTQYGMFGNKFSGVGGF
jgi:hypothetical protein